ncbi:MAG: hypothetical protein NTX17_09310 [Candidatus Eisenbacteria bacterium]|nr:hypothetical protein [Candidatus Eisenbacteria bacterium]
MKHSFLWALVLLVLWSVPGCSSTESKHSATIVIAEGNSLVYKKAGPNEPTTFYGTGSRIVVELIGDTCYVNGQAYLPQPAVPPTVYPLETLKSKYGKVPFVLEYVRGHSGDETEVWNEACREWEEQPLLLAREVVRRYASDVRSHSMTPEAAADTAVATLRASPFVVSAHEDERSRQGNLVCRMISVQWAGESDWELLLLDPHPILDWPRPKPMKLEEFKSFVHLLRSLEGKGPVTIELKGGNLNYISGPGTRERIEEQRRGE